MLLNLSDVLGEHHKTIEREIPVEMDSIIHETNSYPILLKEQLSLKIEHVKGREPDGEQSEELDETNYIDGYELDVEQLLCNEVLIGWPTKILCSNDCKGICNVCGQNLNQGACGCEDTSLDPRMSVIRDVFKNFKEV